MGIPNRIRLLVRVLPMAVMLSACGHSWDSLGVSAGRLRAAETGYGSGDGWTLDIVSIEAGEWFIAEGIALRFDRVGYEGDDLSRATCSYGLWLGCLPWMGRSVVGGSVHWTDSGDWGIGPAVEASAGVVRETTVCVFTAEVFAKADAWLGSRDGAFDSGLGGSVGWRLGLVASF